METVASIVGIVLITILLKCTNTYLREQSATLQFKKIPVRKIDVVVATSNRFSVRTSFLAHVGVFHDVSLFFRSF